MSELAPYFQLLQDFDHRNIIALDRAHNMFLVGAVLSLKPDEVLELGVGTGYVTSSLIHALAYNKKGRLTSVDNWLDWGGNEPPGIAQIRRCGVTVVTMGEEEFVRQAPSDKWDLMVSDADHMRSAEWIDQHIRIVKNGGFMFFHDTNQPNIFPGLATIESQLRERGLFCHHFRQSSRADEHCQRGWLFAVNKK
ncbi:MAG TPA: class I SAM-dependent methyltransferase [Phycisphaerae bacterium]|nr:class I SAM-dependent methyltransferase [Phycisphaerae bacterium]